MKLRKTISLCLAVLLAAALPVQALAAEYDLAQGPVTVNATESGQTVTQNDTENTHSYEETVTITQTGEGTTDNTITIQSDPGQTAQVTIQDLNVDNAVSENRESANAINVTDGASAVIQVSGENVIQSHDEEGKAAVHVGEGSDVTITGNGSLVVDSNYSTGIGTNQGESLSGSITIGGDVKVQASSSNGAAIGSGGAGYTRDEETGAVLESHPGAVTPTGSITIRDNAEVDAFSFMGAGIGSGAYEEMGGTIEITGNAQVTSTSIAGAGIGSGAGGAVSGSVSIGGNANVIAQAGYGDIDGFQGAAIGSGTMGSVTNTGSITIQENAQVSATGMNSTAIGSGSGLPDRHEGEIWDLLTKFSTSQDPGRMDGSITIDGNAQVNAITTGGAPGIGASPAGSVTGTVQILGNASVTVGEGAVKENPEGGSLPDMVEATGKPGYIGAPEGQTNTGVYAIGTNTKINGISGAELEALKGIVKGQLQSVGFGGMDKNMENTITFRNAVYQVVDKDGKWLSHAAEQEGDTLTVTVEAETASFVTTRSGLETLAGRGVKTIVFVTTDKTSRFAVAEALGAFPSGKLVLTHTGAGAALTLAGENHDELLK